MIPIQNANTKNLTQFEGAVPNMSETLDGWQIIQNFSKMIKVLVDGRVQETEEPITFEGVIQNLRSNDLQIKTEGQRDFNWKMIHTKTGEEFDVDDRVRYKNVIYRIMLRKDWLEYGYFEYHLMQDYEESIE